MSHWCFSPHVYPTLWIFISQIVDWLLTPRPLAELFPDPQLPRPSPCENINKHYFYYCYSGKSQDPTRSPVPPILGVQRADSGSRSSSGCSQSSLSCRMWKCNASGPSLKIDLEKTKRLRPRSPASSFLLFQDGKNKPCTQTNTHPASLSNKWQGLGASMYASVHKVNHNSEGRRWRKLITDFNRLLGQLLILLKGKSSEREMVLQATIESAPL